MLDEFKKIQKSSEKPLNPRRKTLNFADEISRQSTALKDITEWDRESGWESHNPTPKQSVRESYVPLSEPLQSAVGQIDPTIAAMMDQMSVLIAQNKSL